MYNNMKLVIISMITVLMLSNFLIVKEAQCQNYDRVLRALEKLEASIQLLKQNYVQREQISPEYADVRGKPAVSKSNGDPFEEFAINLENVVGELHGMIEETQKAEMNRPRNPPSIKHGKISIGGFVHQQYYNQGGDDDESTFNSKRARFSLKGKINDYAAIKIQGELASTPKLLDGVLTFSPDKKWSFCVGQYKPPFGTDFLKSATVHPFINTSKAKALGSDRDIGSSITYRNKVNEDLSLKVSAGAFNGSGINTSDANSDKNFIARAEFNLRNMFTITANALSGANNETGTAREDISAYGGSLTWNWLNEVVEGEFIYSKAGDIERSGWYIWGGHSFDLGWKFLPVVQALARYEQYDVDLDVSNNRLDRITVGTNLFIDKQYAKVQLNYHINGEEANSVDNNEFLANFQVSF